jgi:hypothetical protein
MCWGSTYPERLQVRLMPGPEDMRALYQHALAVGLQLTVVGEDDKVRLRAAQWVAGEAEKSGKLEEEARKLRAEDVPKIEEILGRRRETARRPRRTRRRRRAARRFWRRSVRRKRKSRSRLRPRSAISSGGSRSRATSRNLKR